MDILHYYDNMPEYGIKDSVLFGIKRIKKIYPLHVIMTLGACIMYEFSRRAELIADAPQTIIASVIKLVSNLTLISGWIPSDYKLVPYFSEYNIPSWYLSLSLLFYILLPSIIKIMRKLYKDYKPDETNVSNKAVFRPITAIILILIFVITLNLIHVVIFGKNRAFWYNYESPLSRIGDYLIGMQIGYIFLSFGRERRLNKWILCAMAAINAAVFVICLNFSSDTIWLASSGFYFSLPTAGLILFMAMAEPDFESALNCKALKPIYGWAALTGYAYLIHVPVINAVHSLIKRLGEINMIVWVAVAFTTTMILAYLYNRLIQKKL